MDKLTTPREVDTALAAACHVEARAKARLASVVKSMREGYSRAVLGHRVQQFSRAPQFPAGATVAAAVNWFRSLEPQTYMFKLTGYSGVAGATVAEYDARLADWEAADAEAAKIDALYTGWSRFFVVTSSTGHIHSSRSCHTCRPTTTYGWLPDLSGQSQAEAIEGLRAKGGDRAASALCSVCFPDAPVVHVGGKITKSQAEKMAA